MDSPTEESALAQTQTTIVQNRRRLHFRLLILLGLLCGLSFFLDDAIIRFITEHRTKPLKNLAGFISNYGDWPWLMAAALPFLLWAWCKKRPALLRLVVLAMIASSIAGLAANVLKHTTGRTRPNNIQAEPGWYGLRLEGKWLLGKNKFASFPSGHTATAAGFFAVLTLQRKLWAILWLLPPILMAICRMTIDAHHFSDVCFGAWFGLVAAWWVVESPRFATCRFWKLG